MATIVFSHNSSLQQVAHILGLLVQDGLGRPVALDGLEPLRSLHLPGYDECPSLYTHSLFKMQVCCSVTHVVPRIRCWYWNGAALLYSRC